MSDYFSDVRERELTFPSAEARTAGFEGLRPASPRTPPQVIDVYFFLVNRIKLSIVDRRMYSLTETPSLRDTEARSSWTSDGNDTL